MISYADYVRDIYNSGAGVTSRTLNVNTGIRTHGLLAVVINVITGGDVSSVTWNGQELTRAVETGNPPHSSEIWFLEDFGGGSHDLIVNFSSPSVSFHIVASWFDSDTTLELGEVESASFDLESQVWVDLETTAAGSLCIQGFCSADNNVPLTASDTVIDSWDQGGNVAGMQYKIAALPDNYVVGYARNPTGGQSPFRLTGAVFYEPSTNLPPEVSLNTPDGASFASPTPTLSFTGHDEDDVSFEIQISDGPNFESGSNLRDNFDGGGGAAIHPNPDGSATTWEGNPQVDDRPGQSFTAHGGVLDQIQMRFGPHESVPENTDGTALVRVYAHSGVFGESSFLADAADPEDTPTPGWLAISDPLPFSPGVFEYDWRTFTFSGANRIYLEPGEHYVLVIDWIPKSRDYTNTINVSGDAINGGDLHPGNAVIDASIANNNGFYPDWDIHFRVYEFNVVLSAKSSSDAGFSGTDPYSPETEVTYTVQEALSQGRVYYWRVRAIDPAGSNVYGGWSEVRSFTIEPPAQSDNEVQIGDSASGHDALGSLTVGLSLTDSGLGIEVPEPSATLSTVDFGAAQEDIFSFASVFISDLGGGLDDLGQTLSSLSVLESAQGQDSLGQFLSLLQVQEDGSGGDLLGILSSLGILDSGMGVDSQSVSALSQIVDQALAEDSLDLAASLSIIDQGVALDGAEISVVLQIPDVGNGLDSINLIYEIVKTVLDSGIGVDGITLDFSPIHLEDAGLGVDFQQIAATLSLSDPALGVDLLNLITEHLLVIADSALGVDLSTVSISPLEVSDFGGGIETINLQVNVGITDSALGIEVVSVLLAVYKAITDIATGTDALGQITVRASLPDAGIGVDLVRLTALLSVLDAAQGIDIAVSFDSATRIISVTFSINRRSVDFDLSSRSISFDIQE